MIAIKLVVACAIAFPIAFPIAITSGLAGAGLLACVAIYYIAAVMVFSAFVMLGMWHSARQENSNKRQSEPREPAEPRHSA